MCTQIVRITFGKCIYKYNHLAGNSTKTTEVHILFYVFSYGLPAYSMLNVQHCMAM